VKGLRLIAAAVAVLLALVVTSVALADESAEPLYGIKPSLEDSLKAMEEGPRVGPETDSQAAEKLPHQDLNRGEAIELLTSVFGPEVEETSLFTGLEVEKFLAPNIAVADAGTLEAGAGEASKQSESADQGPVLLESSIPLRVENDEGEKSTLDLSLERNEGELQPEAPLVELSVPNELGEGISLPETGVTISLEGAPADRSPSAVAGEAAVYPNVAQNTDLVVVPSPTGVETFSQLRSEDSPRTESFNLELPAGAALEKTKDGGAEVVRGKETLLIVPPASAIDATGAPVPVDLETAGSSLTLQVSPGESAAFPILVDPVFETYHWAAGNGGWAWPAFAGWISASNDGGVANYYDWEGPSGLFIADGAPAVPGNQTNWNYYVPRFTSDFEKYGVRPTTYINGATLENFSYKFSGVNPSRQSSLYFQGGIWDSINGGWISVGSRNGEEGQILNATLNPFVNGNHNANGKNFGVALISSENVSSEPAYVSHERRVLVGTATLELTDNDAPALGSLGSPSGWMNKTPTAQIPFSVSDPGLGVYKITVTQPGGKPFETLQGCTGGAAKPCPRKWASTEAGVPQIAYDPSVMPSGEDWVKIAALDPVGHSSAEAEAKQAEVRIKVDHIAPAIALTGSITEQASLGTSRPSYEVEINAKDGTTENPQSGVAKTTIEVDGKVVNESAPGCTTQNCSVSRKWPLEASQYTSGQHLLKVVATDAVGNTMTASQSFKLQPAAPPSVELAGTATQQATLGTSRPRYVLKVNASTSAGFNGMPMAAPTYASSLGSAGTGKGQFASVRGTVVDSQGNLWAVDRGNGRVEEFNAKGEYLSQFGEPGSNPGQLSQPYGLALDAAGDFWVTSSDNRIEEFSPAGKFIKQFGKWGTADGLLNSPVDLAFDAKGNLWVVENGNNRLQEFTTEGKFLKKVGSEGHGNGQFETPWGITIAPDGSIWVADTWNSRIQKFDAEGKFVATYGEPGGSAPGNGNMVMPTAIRSDQAGNIYVSEAWNRILVFNSSGEYLTQFGSAGKGPGQFSYASYIAIDPTGNIWVDNADSEVQRWRAPVPPPTFSLSFGSKGTGAGQFTTPSGVTTDSAGNVWVVDRANARIEKFNAKGEFLSQFGTKGSGAGQLSSPWGVAIDPSGNVWVTDTTNVRVVEFNGKGEFVATFGTNVNKTKVEAGGTQTEKNLCTAASKNVCQAGTAGSAEGQLKTPTGITTSAGGNIFVVEKGNGRVEKFSPTGELLANFGKPGSALGQLSEPSAVAMSPDGNYLWVADSGNSRIEEWTSTYSFVRSVGQEGSGNGQFFEPYGLAIDSKGNVLVADTWSNRIQEFNSNGDFLTKFGKSGTGEGLLSSPYALSGDASGNVWIADTGHNQIQKWIPPTSRASTITTEISVDGTPVSTKVGRCGAESCSITPEWILEASAYPGKHTIQVKATDGLGRSTTKTLTVELLKDTVKPTLEVKGTLFSTPEGWIEQQGYGVNASAKDTGYGVTSLSLKIDQTTVAETAAGCVDGGCELILAKSIDMSKYDGGSHTAELVATDGAGNSAIRTWTLNVDPSGVVSTNELTSTLEAVEETSVANPIGPAKEESEYEGTQAGLSLETVPGAMEARGGAAPTSIAVAPSNGISVTIPSVVTPDCGPAPKASEGELTAKEEEELPRVDEACKGALPQASQIEIYPKTVSKEAGSAKATSGEAAAVTPNILAGVDLVTRPLYDGAMTFASIREPSGPEVFTWVVQLEEGQQLTQIDEQHAEVYWSSGHPAFAINAVPAHDAVGTAVPTTLSVLGKNEIALKVAHRNSGFVYPIIAGAGWEGGFQTSYVVMPPPEPMPLEECVECETAEEFFVEESKVHTGVETYGPPVAEASSSVPLEARVPASPPPRRRAYNFDECAWEKETPNEYDPGAIPPDPHYRAQMSQQCHGELDGAYGGEFHISYAMSMSGTFHYKWGNWVWVTEPPTCRKWGPKRPALVHCHMETKWGPTPGHLDVIGDFRFPAGDVDPSPLTTCYTLDGVLPVRPVFIPGEPVLHGRLHNPHMHAWQGEPCPWGHFPQSVGR
jgi:sugar lactone lactonase YvrE